MKMENKQELPAGWKWVKLGEVCEIIMGQSPPSTSYNKINKGLPFFQGKADFDTYFPKVRIWCSQPIKIVEEGTILISVRAPVGPVNISNTKCCIGRGLAGIRMKEEKAFNWYFFWYLFSKEHEIASIGSGSTFSAISKGDLANLVVPLPPLSEQRRIAEKLKAMMDEIEEAKASIEKQLEAAKALPSAYLREVFESPEAQKWEKKKLGEVCEIIKGKKPILYDENTSNKALPYLTAEVIRYNLKPKWCLESNGDVVRVNKDEIVIIADGSNSGEVFIGFEGALASTMGKLKIINENVSTDFLYLFIKKNFNELNAPKRGSAIPHLEKDIFYNLSIPLPPLSEQKRIASYLKEKIDQAEKLRETLEKELETLNALPQSILSKAFRGEI
jgi:type I restriction enzyme S subunit